jgi:chitin disaccharide deacetylase
MPGVQWAGLFGARSDSVGDRVSAMIELIERLGPGLWLLVEHPRMDTPEMRGIVNQGYKNVAEDRSNVPYAFTSDQVQAAIKERGIKLVSYSDVIGK